MQEPPTSIIQPSPAHGPRFVRSGNGAPPQAPDPPKPKLKKLRLALVVFGLGVLAVISTVFGMLMAVASDLPSLDSEAQYRAAQNSVLYPRGPECPTLDPDKCPRIAKLTGNLNRILVKEGEISPNLKNAVIAIEDRRFYQHHGVDYTGIARALTQDILRRKASQGGSTITQQFVKNALSAQGDRTVFQKLREAALAYHLERKWSKEKILTQYLNTVYFGNGAYGVEAAARTYFGDGDEPDEQSTSTNNAGVTLQPAPTTTDEAQTDPDARESRVLSPAEAALLAGMISSPSMYDPLQHPVAARQRRDLVLSRMRDQKMITRGEYEDAVRQAVPDEDQVDPPNVESEQPYFTSWVTGQLLDRYTAAQVFSGGLNIRTTIDPELQAAAQQAIAGRLAGIGPSASLVAIDNDTGEVRALVGGPDFNARPFNLATNGHRQPGSAIKPFILARALGDGVDPNSTWASQPKIFPVPGSGGKEKFPVSNYDDAYSGILSLWSATATSDNSVFAELGLKVGTKRIARLAERMGIRTKLSTNPAMTLGGLKEGVTPLEMAYAYSTIANHGLRATSSFLSGAPGPIGFDEVKGRGIDETNRAEQVPVLPGKVADLEKEMLHLVVTSGTGKAAQVGDEYIWGKTGTTENYGDAWFVGGNDEMTVAVWVGYADKVQSMETEHAGGPVAGGTFPAEIFHDFMTAWVQMRDARRAARHQGDDETQTPVSPTQTIDPNAVPDAEQPAQTTPQDKGGGQGTGQDQPNATPAPDTPGETPDQQAPAPAEPAPTPTQPPTGGGGGGTGGGVTPGAGTG
jgi:penicillin-binding protein 1A